MSSKHLAILKSYRLYTLGEYGIVLEIAGDSDLTSDEILNAQQSLISFASKLRAMRTGDTSVVDGSSSANPLNVMLDGIDEIIPAQLNITLAFSGDWLCKFGPMTNYLTTIEKLWAEHCSIEDRKLDNTAKKIRIPIVYGGDDTDLTALSTQLDLSPEQIITAHSSASYNVMFLGLSLIHI